MTILPPWPVILCETESLGLDIDGDSLNTASYGKTCFACRKNDPLQAALQNRFPVPFMVFRNPHQTGENELCRRWNDRI
jgi:hypothetical protein